MGTILILEDNRNINRLLYDVLTRDGHTCHSAYTVAEAEPIIARERLDIAILDMNLPGQSGLEALGRLRRDHRQTVTTIVLTANPRFQDSAEAAGADFFLVKPLQVQTLRTLIERILRAE